METLTVFPSPGAANYEKLGVVLQHENKNATVRLAVLMAIKIRLWDCG